jgi:hypothetical protein
MQICHFVLPHAPESRASNDESKSKPARGGYSDRTDCDENGMTSALMSRYGECNAAECYRHGCQSGFRAAIAQNEQSPARVAHFYESMLCRRYEEGGEGNQNHDYSDSVSDAFG